VSTKDVLKHANFCELFWKRFRNQQEFDTTAPCRINTYPPFAALLIRGKPSSCKTKCKHFSKTARSFL